ncbi:MAG: agmatinase [bacterium]|nr:MAG: agmatinase [bacterium]
MSEQTKHFMGEYCDYETAKIAVLPVPLECSTSYLQGTARGPEAIIEASSNVELYDIELNDQPYLKGIHTLPSLVFPADEPIRATLNKIEMSVAKILKHGKFPVILGGEHTISYPIFLTVHNRYPNSSILHLDAHTDLRDQYLDDPFSHACVMRRIRMHTKNIVSIGIRSMSQQEADYIKKQKPIIYYDDEIHRNGLPIDQILQQLTDDVYISFDLDVINPAEMPSVGTPEPGGLNWYQVVELFEQVFANKNVVAVDVVELKPDQVNKHSDFWAAKMIYKMIGLKFC